MSLLDSSELIVKAANASANSFPMSRSYLFNSMSAIRPIATISGAATNKFETRIFRTKIK